MLTADVVVVGGGPAGAAAAITSARAGADVLLVDKARFPRDKFCGDGLTAGALRLLEGLGLSPPSVGSWTVVEDVAVRSPSGRTVVLPLPRDGLFATVARRFELDARLVDLARAAGVQIEDGHACTGAAQDAEGVDLEVDGLGSVRCRWVVAADGIWSPLRKRLGVDERGYLGEWHAFRQYFSGVSAASAPRIHVFFEPDILPGYAWSFPLAGGRANVGFGIRRGGRITVREMKQLWPDLLSRPHLKAVLGPAARPEGPHRSWPIPARIDTAVLTAGRVLFAGDAAGATDPMTGEGIAQALLTGSLASEAIALGGHAAAVRARYEREVRHHLLADHRMSAVLSRTLSHRKGARAAVFLAGLTPWTRKNFARWLFEDYPRAVLFTPRRWRRRIFTGRGAY